MQYFLLLTNLVIAFVHWVSTGVLYKPRQCSLFWDYIPESKRCFGVILCRPSGPYSIRPIQKLLNCQTAMSGMCCSSHPDGEQPRSALWLWNREMTWYLYTREVRGRMRQNNADLKLLDNCVMNDFIMFGIMFMMATGLENSPQSFDAYTISQSRSVVTSAENPAPENSPQSIGESGKLARGQFTRTIIPDWFEKMAWYKILIHVLILQTPVSGSCCLPLGALLSMWATWCKI